MSYILEALKKSDRERRVGVGMVSSVSYAVAPQRRAGHAGVAVLAGGMLITGLALGAWHPWLEPAPPGEQPPVAVSSLPAVGLAAAPPPSPETSLTAATAQVPLPPQAVSVEPTQEVVLPIPLPVTEEKPPPKPRKAARAQGLSRAVGTAPSGETATDLGIQAPPAVVGFRELPAEVQGSLPRFVFGGYAGAEDAEARIAFINNRLVKEGEEVAPGVRLEQVGRDGVVLGYQGYRFRPAQ